MEAPDPDDLTAVAVEAGRIGAEVLRAGWAGELAVRPKGAHGDIVTEIDLAAEEEIRSYVTARRPDDAFIGEETTPRQVGADIAWIVDPIDGTANYLRRGDHCAVSIGVTVRGRHVVGVVVQPGIDRFWVGDPSGATRNGSPIRVAGRAGLAEAIWATGFAHAPTDRDRQISVFVEMMGAVLDCRRSGSPALDLAHVADGTVDGYVEFGLGAEDYAGGVALVRAAGGSVDVVDIHPWRGPLVIAAGSSALVSEMRELVRGCGVPGA